MASTPFSDIPLPKEVTDPLYTSSQSSLNQIGSGLLSGNIPDYYKSIGDFDSPQFQAMLNSVKGQIMQGSQESSAINGTGRSGVATTASNNALNQVVPQLTYQDYLRAMQGRGALLDTGINTETGVRGSAQNQQQFDTNFNQTLWQDQMAQAGAIDQYKKQASQAQGSLYGTLGGLALGAVSGGLGLLPGLLSGTSALSGALIGGSAGAGLGGSLFGGGGQDSGLSSLLGTIGKLGTSNGSSASYGIADQGLGSFKSLSSLNSSNPDIAALLNGGF